MTSMITSFFGIGVRFGIVTAFDLLNACALNQSPVAFTTQKMGEICEKADYLLWSAAKRLANNLSITSFCLRGSDRFSMTQCLEPGFDSLLW